MLNDPRYLFATILAGAGATLLIDLWSLLLKRGFNIPSLSYCLLGRWILHMPSGTLVHQSIGAAAPKRFECALGWVSHYLIGTGFALAFVLVVSSSWLEHPTLWPALVFGVVTTLVPFCIMQPALGLGFAASRTARPNQARLKSLMTHTVFGLGLWLWALPISRLLLRD